MPAAPRARNASTAGSAPRHLNAPSACRSSRLRNTVRPARTVSGAGSRGVRGAMNAQITAGRSALGAEPLDLLLEAGEDRLDEGVLQDATDALAGARLRAADGPGDVGLRRDVFGLLVLEKVGEAADDHLVELVKEALLLVLLGVVDLHPLEKGLDVAVHLAVLDPKLRVEGELPRGHVEFPVGPQDVVHRRHLRVLDREVEVEVGLALVRTVAEGRDRRAGPHELPAQRRDRRALAELIGQGRDLRVGAREGEPVPRGCLFWL